MGAFGNSTSSRAGDRPRPGSDVSGRAGLARGWRGLHSRRQLLANATIAASRVGS
jgi:hypothetical protein